MKQLLIAVRDAKAEFFSAPMVVRTRGEAIRSFSDAVNTEGTQFHGHAEDFSLFLLGALDVLTGVITPEIQPLSIVTGLDVLRTVDIPVKVAR